MKKYVTMKEISDRLGVSRSAVSFALNDRYDGVRVSEELRGEIKRVAKEMGYCRNAIVDSLQSGRTRLLAFLIQEGLGEYVYRCFSGFIDQASSDGYFVKIFKVDSDFNVHDSFRLIIEQRIEGIAARLGEATDVGSLVELGRERGMPVAFYDQGSYYHTGTFVKPNDFSGINEAVKHLIELGHHRIALFSIHKDEKDERFSAYLEAMSRNGLTLRQEDIINASEYARQAVLVKEMLSRSPEQRPSAILCSTDYLAAITFQEAFKLTLSIPDDLSVIGFADLSFTEAINLNLTSIRQPFEDIGAKTAKLLIKSVEKGVDSDLGTQQVELIETSLVLRGSTAPA